MQNPLVVVHRLPLVVFHIQPIQCPPVVVPFGVVHIQNVFHLLQFFSYSTDAESTG